MILSGRSWPGKHQGWDTDIKHNYFRSEYRLIPTFNLIIFFKRSEKCRNNIKKTRYFLWPLDVPTEAKPFTTSKYVGNFRFVLTLATTFDLFSSPLTYFPQLSFAFPPTFSSTSQACIFCCAICVPTEEVDFLLFSKVATNYSFRFAVYLRSFVQKWELLNLKTHFFPLQINFRFSARLTIEVKSHSSSACNFASWKRSRNVAI